MIDHRVARDVDKSSSMEKPRIIATAMLPRGHIASVFEYGPGDYEYGPGDYEPSIAPSNATDYPYPASELDYRPAPIPTRVAPVPRRGSSFSTRGQPQRQPSLQPQFQPQRQPSFSSGYDQPRKSSFSGYDQPRKSSFSGFLDQQRPSMSSQRRNSKAGAAQRRIEEENRRIAAEYAPQRKEVIVEPPRRRKGSVSCGEPTPPHRRKGSVSCGEPTPPRTQTVVMAHEHLSPYDVNPYAAQHPVPEIPDLGYRRPSAVASHALFPAPPIQKPTSFSVFNPHAGARKNHTALAEHLIPNRGVYMESMPSEEMFQPTPEYMADQGYPPSQSGYPVPYSQQPRPSLPGPRVRRQSRHSISMQQAPPVHSVHQDPCLQHPRQSIQDAPRQLIPDAPRNSLHPESRRTSRKPSAVGQESRRPSRKDSTAKPRSEERRKLSSASSDSLRPTRKASFAKPQSRLVFSDNPTPACDYLESDLRSDESDDERTEGYSSSHGSLDPSTKITLNNAAVPPVGFSYPSTPAPHPLPYGRSPSIAPPPIMNRSNSIAGMYHRSASVAYNGGVPGFAHPASEVGTVCTVASVAESRVAGSLMGTKINENYIPPIVKYDVASVGPKLPIERLFLILDSVEFQSHDRQLIYDAIKELLTNWMTLALNTSILEDKFDFLEHEVHRMSEGLVKRKRGRGREPGVIVRQNLVDLNKILSDLVETHCKDECLASCTRVGTVELSLMIDLLCYLRPIDASVAELNKFSYICCDVIRAFIKISNYLNPMTYVYINWYSLNKDAMDNLIDSVNKMSSFDITRERRVDKSDRTSVLTLDYGNLRDNIAEKMTVTSPERTQAIVDFEYLPYSKAGKKHYRQALFVTEEDLFRAFSRVKFDNVLESRKGLFKSKGPILSQLEKDIKQLDANEGAQYIKKIKLFIEKVRNHPHKLDEEVLIWLCLVSDFIELQKGRDVAEKAINMVNFIAVWEKPLTANLLDFDEQIKDMVGSMNPTLSLRETPPEMEEFRIVLHNILENIRDLESPPQKIDGKIRTPKGRVADDIRRYFKSLEHRNRFHASINKNEKYTNRVNALYRPYS